MEIIEKYLPPNVRNATEIHVKISGWIFMI